MEQIYYTQCPIGYGLGASNGFQIKRLSTHYPLNGDFRHFGLRPFVPGSRTLAPPVLRYRLATDGIAEIAFLSPRTHEYQTERGLWGRPGGHFAHAIRLDLTELQTLHHWPAGLFDNPIWKRADPEPTLGRPPDPLPSAWNVPGPETHYKIASKLAASLDPSLLASLLSSLASVIRTGRTLFIIDRPDRLANHISLLTLAFPQALRLAITFSTYHDRPDDLPNLRLQGTAPDPRLNRQTLLTQGIVADFSTGTIEPFAATPRWAITLANWLIGNSLGARSEWEETGHRLDSQPPSLVSSPFPEDDWLDHLYELPSILHPPPPSSSMSEDWTTLANLNAWARTARLGAELARVRDPAWWSAAATDKDSARHALGEHLLLPEAWQRTENHEVWGKALASWLACARPDRQTPLLDAAIKTTPPPSRSSFLKAIIASSTPELAQTTIDWLKTRPGIDSVALLPLEVKGIVQRVEKGDPAPLLRNLLVRASTDQAALNDVLTTLAQETTAKQHSRNSAIKALTDHLFSSDQPSFRVLLQWALDRLDDAQEWLAPFLRTTSQKPDAMTRWEHVKKNAGVPRQASLARIALDSLLDSSIPDEVFTWAVESLLLPLETSHRPQNPRWAGAYLDKTPSGLDLMRRLFTRKYRDLGIKTWLDVARAQGDLVGSQVARIDQCTRFAKALQNSDARAFARLELPSVPPLQRGELLGQILSHLKIRGLESLGFILDTCRVAWPEAFNPGAEGLSGLAQILANTLIAERHDPSIWLERLSLLLEHLRLVSPPDYGFEPNSLAAEIVALTTRSQPDDFSPWRLRQTILKHEKAWRLLAADIRLELNDLSPQDCLNALEHWDRNLSKGLQTPRFFEVWLNSCNPQAMPFAIAARAEDLRTLPPLPWWDHSLVPDAPNDLRDAFARFAPLAPLAETVLSPIQGWIRRPPPPRDHSGRVFLPTSASTDLLPIDNDPAPLNIRKIAFESPLPLSEFGLLRWKCIEALSTFYRPGLAGDACWQVVEGWYQSLPLVSLETDEKYLFLARLIPKLDPPDPFRIARLASWLVRSHLSEPDRLTHWAETLTPSTDIPTTLRLSRAPLVADLRSEWKTLLREARERPIKTNVHDSPPPA